MDAFACNGYDVWAIDIHGYGLSDKTDKDWSDTASAALDLGAAIEYICDLRKIKSVRLLGWSWGALVAGLYTETHADRVCKLVLYSATWLGERWKGGSIPQQQYRENTTDGARADFVDGEYEQDVVDAYAKEALAGDPRSPNGVIVDIITKMPILEPEKISVPTLVLRPERDFAASEEEMVQFFRRLGTHEKTFVSFPRSGHAAILEKGHLDFQRVIIEFCGH